MTNKIYGYVWVSARDQNEDRQLLAMQKYPIPAGNIYLDKMSGKDFNHPAYQKLIRRMKPGDLLVIKSIDRLGRNYREIIEQWGILTKDKGVDIQVLDMPLLDTRQCKDLLGTFISDLVLQLLSFVAENERSMIKQRQAEGIAAAKQRGVRFGRPPKEIPARFHELEDLWKRGRVSSREAAMELKVSYQTFLRWIRMNQKTCLLVSGE